MIQEGAIKVAVRRRSFFGQLSREEIIRMTHKCTELGTIIANMEYQGKEIPVELLEQLNSAIEVSQAWDGESRRRKRMADWTRRHTRKGRLGRDRFGPKD